MGYLLGRRIYQRPQKDSGFSFSKVLDEGFNTKIHDIHPYTGWGIMLSKLSKSWPVFTIFPAAGLLGISPNIALKVSLEIPTLRRWRLGLFRFEALSFGPFFSLNVSRSYALMER